jgi:transposase
VAASSSFQSRFYNQQLRPFYDSLTLPTKRDFAAPNTVRSNRFAITFEHRDPHPEAPFRHKLHTPPNGVNAQPRPEISQPFAPHGVNVAQPTSKGKRRKRELDGQLRTFRVRMIPTLEQKRELKRTFSAARHAYNWTVTAMKGGKRANFMERRNEYRASARPEWAKCVSSNIVAGAVEQAVNAVTSNLAKRAKNGGNHHFDVKYRSTKVKRTEVVRIDPDSTETAKTSTLLKFAPVPYTNSENRAECLAFFGSNLKKVGGIRLRDSARVVNAMLAEGNRLTETCKIQRDRRADAYYFYYTYALPAVADPDPTFQSKRVVATDPGVRNFQTFYSPTSGEMGTLLDYQRTELDDKCRDLDARASWLAKRGNAYSDPKHTARRTRRQRQRTFRDRRRACAKARANLHNWMHVAHYDAANFLLRKYDLVIAPKLETAKMVPHDGRIFGSKTARAMLTWSHSLFTQRLTSAAYRYPGRCVISDSGEPGTSRTCTHCGHWFANLGANSTFDCPRCGLCINRDVAGARNNFLAAYGAARGMGWDGITH